MIDIDKIEADAKAVNRDDNTMDDLWEHWRQNGPATVLEMVGMIRERDAQVVQLQEQNTMLDAKLSEVEAVLKQALDFLQRVRLWREKEVESDPDLHDMKQAIKKVLK